MAGQDNKGQLSIRVLVTGSLVALVLSLSAAIVFVLYELDLRKHDYQILNLAGQMRVIASRLERQGQEMEASGLLSVADLDRDFSRFERDVAQDVALYDQIIKGFVDRELPAELIGSDEALRCNWDQRSVNQLDRSASDWTRYRDGLRSAAGPDPLSPKTLSMAAYMAAAGPDLIRSTEDLAESFQRMMEGKLLLIRLTVLGMAAGAVAAVGGLVVVLRRLVLKPLDIAVLAFDRVAAGDLGYQAPVARTRELGVMTRAFNHLSTRLHALFGLTDKIGRGADVDQTLAFIHQEFRRFLPVDWVALLVAAPDHARYLIERVHGSAADQSLREVRDPALAQAARATVVAADSGTARFLAREGMASGLILPLASVREGGAVLLVGARRPQAYGAQDQAFLQGIASHVDSVLARTMVMDSLVVASVQGLAKLAESRDPETGDHLVRMSLYSALLAEELASDPGCPVRIDPAYVRDIHRFAPMHDIGKVGIPDAVLLKPGRLDDVERAEMCKHPLIGEEVLRLCEERLKEEGRSVFSMGVEIAGAHHEKWDGSGYPRGLKGDQIPLSARIVAVADVFDALTSKRPYKEAWPVEKALETLRADSGSHFDPLVVAAFERIMPRVLEIHGRLAHV
jgi:HD-GYP domain-containing protein (c-di-GMP phosphodiesterase class II)